MGQFNRLFGASGTGHSEGVVPDPGAIAGTSRYLREDQSWQVPPVPAGNSLIQEIVQTSGYPGLDFTSIPSTYRHLEVFLHGTWHSTNISQWSLIINNDTTASYFWSIGGASASNYDTVAQLQRLSDNRGEAGSGNSFCHLWFPYYNDPGRFGIFYHGVVGIWNGQQFSCSGYYLGQEGLVSSAINRLTFGNGQYSSYAALYGIT